MRKISYLIPLAIIFASFIAILPFLPAIASFLSPDHNVKVNTITFVSISLIIIDLVIIMLFLSIIFEFKLSILVFSSVLTAFCLSLIAFLFDTITNINTRYSFVSYINALFLFAIFCISFVLFCKIQEPFWIILGIFFGYLGFDELFEVHEAIGRLIASVFGASNDPGYKILGMFNYFDDIATLAVFIVGLIFLAFSHHFILSLWKSDKTTFTLLAFGVLSYSFQIIFEVLHLNFLEESMEMLAATIVLMALANKYVKQKNEHGN